MENISINFLALLKNSIDAKYRFEMNQPKVVKHTFWQPWISIDNPKEDYKQTPAKQLPTTKWKRDRRSRLPEYSRKSDPKLPENVPIEEVLIKSEKAGNDIEKDSGTNTSSSFVQNLNVETVNNISETRINSSSNTDAPLDMSLRVKRGLPPPYTQAIHHTTNNLKNRPSVITQAPYQDNSYVSRSISMCDPIIDEHFRRSLGKDYAVLFSNNNVTSEKNCTKKSSHKPVCFSEIIDTDTTSLSVDDHFAKALGETWIKLNNKVKDNELKNKNGNDKSPQRIVSI